MGGSNENRTKSDQYCRSDVCPEFYDSCLLLPDLCDHHLSDLRHSEAVKDISRSEWQIIQTVGSGMSNKEIAQELSLSEGTVRNSISNILFKLGLRDRTQLAIWAVQTGVVNRPL